MKRFAIIAVLAALTLGMTCGCTSFLFGDPEDDTKPVRQPQATEASPDADDSHASLSGYSHLQNDAEREIYRLIGEYAYKPEGESFRVSGEGQNELVSKVYEVYDTDHPEVFWLGGDYDFEYYNDDGYTVIDLIFCFDASELDGAKKKFDEETEKALSNAPSNGTDFEKELYINDLLIEKCAYNYDAASSDKVVGNEHNAYGALIEGSAVCEGYAKAFQHLSNKLGLECVSLNGVCEGDTAFSGNHIWNCVRLDGDWYHVDVTWNDYDKEDDNISREVIAHSYLNLTDDEIKKDHTINPLYYSDEATDSSKSYNAFIPECTADKYNYFACYYPTLTSLDDTVEIEEALTKAAADGEDIFIINVDDSLDFSSTYQEVLDSYAYQWLTTANNQNDWDHQIEESCYIYTYGDADIMVFALEYK